MISLFGYNAHCIFFFFLSTVHNLVVFLTKHRIRLWMLSVIVSGRWQVPPWLRECPKAWALLSCVLAQRGQASARCASLSAAGDRGPWSKRSEPSENKFFLNLRFENHHPQCLLNLKFVSSILQEEKKKNHNNLSSFYLPSAPAISHPLTSPLLFLIFWRPKQ